MKWFEYVAQRLEAREPRVAFRDLPCTEYQDWYGDYRREYPEDEKIHSQPYETVLRGPLIGRSRWLSWLR